MSPSATTIASQIPLIPKKIGRMRIAAAWKISVRKNDIKEDKKPLLKEVKKAEPKILNPQRRKESE